jgi:Ser/Thr protein kinase RdoA (MazF antagonist)
VHNEHALTRDGNKAQHTATNERHLRGDADVSLMPLGKPVALGRTAEMYAWKEGQILKLFRDWWPAARVEYEAHIARMVSAAGLPVPAVGEVVEIDGRLGLTFERVDGPSLLETFRTKPWTLFVSARLLAELHADMHACSVPELPSQRQRLANTLKQAETLPADMREAGLKALNNLPDSDQLCHGDLHPANILMTARGPIIVDWLDATRGNPLADVARSSLLLRVSAPPPGASGRWLFRAGRRWFRRTYLERYFQLRPGDRWQLTAWQPVIAAARLRDNIRAEQEQLLALVRAGLSRYDS